MIYIFVIKNEKNRFLLLFFIFQQHFFGEKRNDLARCVPVETRYGTSLHCKGE